MIFWQVNLYQTNVVLIKKLANWIAVYELTASQLKLIISLDNNFKIYSKIGR